MSDDETEQLRAQMIDLAQRIKEFTGRAPTVVACSPMRLTQVRDAAPAGMVVRADPLCSLQTLYMSHETLE